MTIQNERSAHNEALLACARTIVPDPCFEHLAFNDISPDFSGEHYPVQYVRTAQQGKLVVTVGFPGEYDYRRRPSRIEWEPPLKILKEGTGVGPAFAVWAAHNNRKAALQTHMPFVKVDPPFPGSEPMIASYGACTRSKAQKILPSCRFGRLLIRCGSAAITFHGGEPLVTLGVMNELTLAQVMELHAQLNCLQELARNPNVVRVIAKK